MTERINNNQLSQHFKKNTKNVENRKINHFAVFIFVRNHVKLPGNFLIKLFIFGRFEYNIFKNE